MIAALLLLPGAPPPVEEIEVPLVQLVEGDGAAGAAGGRAGGSTSAASESAAEPPQETTSEPVSAPVALPRPPRPRPAPRVTQASPPPKSIPAPQSMATPRPPAPQPGTAVTGLSGAGPGGATGPGQGVTGAGAGAFGSGQGPGDEYLERLRRHLAKHRRYPPDAARQKQEGTVQVEFTLARDGTVLAASIEKSAGYPLLDQAVLDMLRSASPVPPLPERFTGDRIRISLPIGFSLGFFTKLF